MTMTQSKVRGVVFGSLSGVVLALLAASLSASWQAIAQGRNATADQPARLAVMVPRTAMASGATLTISVRAYRKPPAGQIGGIVRLKRPGAGQTVEVGRFSIVAASSFAAATAEDEKRYRFDIGGALRELQLSGDQAEIEVALYDRSGGQTPLGTELTVGGAQISAR